MLEGAFGLRQRRRVHRPPGQLVALGLGGEAPPVLLIRPFPLDPDAEPGDGRHHRQHRRDPHGAGETLFGLAQAAHRAAGLEEQQFVEQGGRVVGVQLFGVRGNSLLGRLGMQNGDVLNRINGLDIASPDRALEAYSRLRTSDSLQVSVTRGGQPVNIDFHIR